MKGNNESKALTDRRRAEAGEADKARLSHSSISPQVHHVMHKLQQQQEHQGGGRRRPS